METTISGNVAVLVIDVQRALFDSNPPPFEAQAVIERINSITKRAREAGALVVFIQNDGKAEEHMLPHSDGWQFHPKLERHPDDLYLRKTTCDAFFDTPLESELRARYIDTLVLTGYATDFCVDATLRSACSKRFKVYVAADAHTTNDSPVLKAEKIRQQHNWAWPNCVSEPGVSVVETTELAFAVPAAARA